MCFPDGRNILWVATQERTNGGDAIEQRSRKTDVVHFVLRGVRAAWPARAAIPAENLVTLNRLARAVWIDGDEARFVRRLVEAAEGHPLLGIAPAPVLVNVTLATLSLFFSWAAPVLNSVPVKVKASP